MRDVGDKLLTQQPSLQVDALARIGQKLADNPGLVDGNTEDPRVEHPDYTTKVRTGPLAAWAAAPGDPVPEVASWLKTGGQSGTSTPFPDVGIFLQVTP